MPDIKDSVGDTGTNNVHDVAMIQAILTVIKDAKNNPYLPDYDGKPGPATTKAITAFQTDQGLAAKPNAAVPDAGVTEKAGLVAKGSTTLTKMVAALPADYKDMQIIEGTSTVYFPGDENDSKASQKAILGKADLNLEFRTKVAKLVEQMYANNKIVLWVTDSGWKRTFDEQQKIATGGTGATGAGPGESNHNFGRAVDIGFNKFTFLKAGGAKATDDWWLNVLTKNEKDAAGNAKAKQLWTARDAIGVTAIGLFNSILPGDVDHLQSFDDHLPNDKALADLLNRAGKMKWEAEHKKPRRYNSDLGLGATMLNVGKATEIWAGNATVTKKMIAQGKTDALIKAAQPKGPVAVKAVVPVLEKDIKDDVVKQMQKALKDDFAAAEAKWDQWKSVP
jgi:peptidoglycan hydrolase-like protein with peptidoglycan-binding domain